MRTSTLSSLLPLCGLLVLVLVAGCATTLADADAAIECTGAKLSVDYFGDTDVIGFHFELERVACDPGDALEPYSVSASVDLVDGVLPGNIDLLEQTLDSDSNHLGSDLFMSLEPGCYDVTAAPASAIDGDDWTPSEDCSTATVEAVEVVDGATTEILLLPGTSAWQITVYDLGWQDGAQVTMESLVAPESSHDDLSFPVHTLYADLPLCMLEGVAVPAEGVDIELTASVMSLAIRPAT